MAVKQLVKKFVYTKYNYRCRKCNTTRDLQLHHVTPQRVDGPDDDWNLVPLCHDCHTAWHRLEHKLGIRYNKLLTSEACWAWIKGRHDILRKIERKCLGSGGVSSGN